MGECWASAERGTEEGGPNNAPRSIPKLTCATCSACSPRSQDRYLELDTRYWASTCARIVPEQLAREIGDVTGPSLPAETQPASSLNSGPRLHRHRDLRRRPAEDGARAAVTEWRP